MTKRQRMRQRVKNRIARARAIWADMKERQDARRRAAIVVRRGRLSLVRQYSRFIVAGVANTAVDFAIFNILFYLYVHATGLSLGQGWYIAFKGISFCAAVANSWFLNKNWVFAEDSAHTDATARDKAMFLLVSSFGFGVNVAVSLVVFSGLQSMGFFGETLNANIGALFGTATALVSNFVGYRLLVFKQHYESTNIPVDRHSRV